MVGEVHRRSAATSSHTYLLGKLLVFLSQTVACALCLRDRLSLRTSAAKLVFVLSPLVYSWWSRDSLVAFRCVGCNLFKANGRLVFQRIDVFSKDFDNRAEVEIGAPWPLPPLEATATLAHKFELLGTCKIKITSEKTTVKTSGNLAQIPPFDIPRLSDSFRPPLVNVLKKLEHGLADSTKNGTSGVMSLNKAWKLERVLESVAWRIHDW
ncbi:hypothetical protein Bca52824_008931 [Brassica carinata]|uniref:Plastid lipid-associated protein/fibrillin conserved domain-containing protein n=1 Tax=Brassica carinata TaxID=52824 RepID=A0A8X7WD26_BRACI|nr:hypothetical protein Bca52824_008931 [Brassica carinata]